MPNSPSRSDSYEGAHLTLDSAYRLVYTDVSPSLTPRWGYTHKASCRYPPQWNQAGAYTYTWALELASDFQCTRFPSVRIFACSGLTLGVAEGPWIAYIQGSSQFRFLVLEFSSSLSASLISVFQCNVNLSVRQRLSSIGRMMPLLGLCRLVRSFTSKLRSEFLGERRCRLYMCAVGAATCSFVHLDSVASLAPHGAPILGRVVHGLVVTMISLLDPLGRQGVAGFCDPFQL